MSLFSRFPSNEVLAKQPCRWCKATIGTAAALDHGPVPLCATCWKTTQQGEPRHRLNEELGSEWRQLVWNGRVAPTRIDMLAAGQEAADDIAKLGSQISQALSKRDTKEADRLSAQMDIMMKVLRQARADSGAALTDLERSEA